MVEKSILNDFILFYQYFPNLLITGIGIYIILPYNFTYLLEIIPTRDFYCLYQTTQSFCLSLFQSSLYSFFPFLLKPLFLFLLQVPLSNKPSPRLHIISISLLFSHSFTKPYFSSDSSFFSASSFLKFFQHRYQRIILRL